MGAEQQAYEEKWKGFDGSGALLFCDYEWALSPKKKIGELRDEWKECMMEWEDDAPDIES